MNAAAPAHRERHNTRSATKQQQGWAHENRLAVGGGIAWGDESDSVPSTAEGWEPRPILWAQRPPPLNDSQNEQTVCQRRDWACLAGAGRLPRERVAGRESQQTCVRERERRNIRFRLEATSLLCCWCNAVLMSKAAKPPAERAAHPLCFRCSRPRPRHAAAVGSSLPQGPGPDSAPWQSSCTP
jgi:hypothetical protein